jgi:hypothetical protein
MWAEQGRGSSPFRSTFAGDPDEVSVDGATAASGYTGSPAIGGENTRRGIEAAEWSRFGTVLATGHLKCTSPTKPFKEATAPTPHDSQLEGWHHLQTCNDTLPS